MKNEIDEYGELEFAAHLTILKYLFIKIKEEEYTASDIFYVTGLTQEDSFHLRNLLDKVNLGEKQ